MSNKPNKGANETYVMRVLLTDNQICGLVNYEEFTIFEMNVAGQTVQVSIQREVGKKGKEPLDMNKKKIKRTT